MVKNSGVRAFVGVATDAIADRAYEIYVERGRTDGCDLDDWLRAERELRTVPTAPGRRPKTR